MGAGNDLTADPAGSQKPMSAVLALIFIKRHPSHLSFPFFPFRSNRHAFFLSIIPIKHRIYNESPPQNFRQNKLVFPLTYATIKAREDEKGFVSMDDFLKKLSGTISSAANAIGKKSADLASQGKLKVDIMKLENKIKDKKTEIGEEVFTAYLIQSPINRERIDGLCEEVKGYLGEIARMKEDYYREEEKPKPKDEAEQDMFQSEEMHICPNCRRVLPKEDAYCSQCGAKAQELTIRDVEQVTDDDGVAHSVCPECGSFVDDEEVFCQFCGTQVNEPVIEKAEGEEPEICPECGSYMNEQNICEFCGTKLNI